MNYKQIASHESIGKYTLGVKISVGGIDCTKEERLLIQSFTDKIHDGILRIREENDPENIIIKKETIVKLTNCFIDPIYVKQIPSEYSSNDFIPWLIVTTSKGPIKIGWRKRVINIDWSESDIQDTDLFPNEDVTKGDKYIHAWGYEKAKSYIETLMRIN